MHDVNSLFVKWFAALAKHAHVRAVTKFLKAEPVTSKKVQVPVGWEKQLSPLRLHGAKATMPTWLAQAGADALTIQFQGHWRTPSMPLTYMRDRRYQLAGR